MSKKGHVAEVVREVVLMRGAGYRGEGGGNEGEEEWEGDQKEVLPGAE